MLAVDSLHPTTHSYTIMPLLAMDGSIKSPMLVVLQERNGSLGPIVSGALPNTPNLVVTASKSGNVTKPIIRQFAEEVLSRNLDREGKCVLLIDQCRVQSDNDLFKLTDKTVHIERFPDKSTPLIQPLDVYGFRQWKLMAKNFAEHCLIYDLDIDVHSRNNVLILQSLILNQLQSPKFVPMWCYSWYAATFPVQKVEFKNVNQLCYSFKQTFCDEKEMDEDCPRVPYHCCSYCDKILCAHHFFSCYHYHHLYQM